jgi:hypothetical protein
MELLSPIKRGSWSMFYYLDRKKGVSSLPFPGESSKNFAEFQAPSFEGPANPKSKIQNPKSGDPLVFPPLSS